MIRLHLPPLLPPLACLFCAGLAFARANPEQPARPESPPPVENPPEPAPAAAALPPVEKGGEAVAAATASPGEPKPDAPKAAGKKQPATTPASADGTGAVKGQSLAELQSLVRLGGTLTDRGDFQAAEIAFRQVLQRRDAPIIETKGALLGLARMHRKQGGLTKAAAIYERYVKDYPEDERVPEALLDLGRSYRALGIHRLATARFFSVLNSTLKISAGNFEHYQLLAHTAQFEIAQTHFDAGDFAEASKYFNRLRLLDVAPADRARAHFMSAYALRLQGEPEKAVTTLKSFIDQFPEDDNIPEARHLLAITLRELKRPQQAYAATLELLRAEQARTSKDPKRWAYWQRRTGNQLANDFFEQGDMVSAHTIYTGLLELAAEPNWRLPLNYQIGLCLERLGSLPEARQSYQKIIETAGATPPPEFVELVRMASWRLEHLTWRDRVELQTSAYFSTQTGKTAATTTPAPVPTAATAAAAPTPTSATP